MYEVYFLSYTTGGTKQILPVRLKCQSLHPPPCPTNNQVVQDAINMIIGLPPKIEY